MYVKINEEILKLAEGLSQKQQILFIGLAGMMLLGKEIDLDKECEDLVVRNILKGQEERLKYIGEQRDKLAAAGKANRRYTDDEIYDACRAHPGAKAVEIARILGCSESTVKHSKGWKDRDKEFRF